VAQCEIKYDGSELNEQLAQFGPSINKTLTLTTDFGADRGTAAMKTKAPWTDRTTNARNGLHAGTDHTGSGAIGFTTHTITFAHGVDYGIWLEVANNGQYQIIMPTVVQVGGEIMKALDDMFKKLGLPPELKIDLDLNGPGRQGSSQGVTVKTEKQARRTKRGATTATTNKTRRS
jgi:hypothetical protein